MGKFNRKQRHGQVQDHFQQRRSKVIVIEEVLAFEDIDKRTGQSFLSAFVRTLEEINYTVSVFKLDHSMWCELPRCRLFIVALAKDFFDDAAVKFLANTIDSVVSMRSLIRPAKLIPDIIDINSSDELERRDDSALVDKLTSS